MKKIIVILTAAVLISACSTSDDEIITPAPKKTYLKSEVIDIFNGATTFSLSSTYAYNSKNQISGIEETSSDTFLSSNKSYSNFVYNSLGNLESYQVQYTVNGTAYHYKITYIYTTAGIVQEATITNMATNTIILRNTYEYTTNGLIHRYVQPSGVVSQTSIYTYNGDNITQAEYKNQAGTTMQIVNFSGYDNKPNPFQLKWAAIPDKIRSINNSSTETRTLSSTGAVTTWQYSFEYNADGYPIKRTDIANGRTATWVYEKR